MNPQTKTVLKCLGVVFGMGAMGWASVPLYDYFCRVTGYGGTTQEASAASDVVLDREIKVRFDASIGQGLAWEFAPEQNTMKLRIGETGLAFYRAHNPTDRPITGTAAFNVTPLSMGGYFAKIECFCFVETTLQPGETMMMPVTFFVDPEMVEDSDTVGINHVTLSYTFYETDPTQAGLDQTDTANGG